jgi:CBS domain-containing protein
MPLKQVIHEWKVRHLDPSKPLIVSPDSTLAQAIDLMKRERAGYVFVCQSEKLVGILTERDILNKVVGLGVGYDAPVKGFMTPNPKVVHEDEPIVTAMTLMNEGNYRHLPLVDESGKVVAVVSARHLIGFIVEHFPQSVVNLPPRLDQRSRTVEGG